MMTIQDQVTPPITYKSSTLGDDPRSYLKYAATQSRQYEAKLVPEWVMHSYTGYNDEARGIASETAPRILTDSINITSQYLIAWIRQVILPWSDRGTPDAHIGVQSVLGAATYGDRPYIFTQAANTVPWLCWCDENHKWAWHKIWVTGSMTPIAARIGAAANAAGPAVFVLGENGNALANWWNATTRDWPWTDLGKPAVISGPVGVVGLDPVTAFVWCEDGDLYRVGVGPNGTGWPIPSLSPHAPICPRLEVDAPLI